MIRRPGAVRQFEPAAELVVGHQFAETGLARLSYRPSPAWLVRLVWILILRYKPGFAEANPAMKNFLRTIKFALRYRGRLIVSFACALIAAGLGGSACPRFIPFCRFLRTAATCKSRFDLKTQDVEKDIAKLEKEIDVLVVWKREVETKPAGGPERDQELHKGPTNLDTKEATLFRRPFPPVAISAGEVLHHSLSAAGSL